MVGVNRFADHDGAANDVFPIDEAQQRSQVERVQRVKRDRDADAVRVALEDLERAASGSSNVLYPMKTALAAMATLGEVADTLRGVFGVYQPN